MEYNEFESTEMNMEMVKEEESQFMRKVYLWMTLALVLTGLMAMYTLSSRALLTLVLGSQFRFVGLLILEFILVSFLSSMVHRMSAKAAMITFFSYAILNGLTFSAIFLVYTSSSIAITFFIAASIFGFMSVYGYFTDNDLTSVGSISMMGLFGIIVASIVNWFLGSEMIYWLISYGGVLVFSALTAYDTQKLRMISVIGNEDAGENQKKAIMGALVLYLDFVNLFLMLLRILGGKKRR